MGRLPGGKLLVERRQAVSLRLRDLRAWLELREGPLIAVASGEDKHYEARW